MCCISVLKCVQRTKPDLELSPSTQKKCKLQAGSLFILQAAVPQLPSLADVLTRLKEDANSNMYIDDILIYATTPELLEKYTKWVLHKLWDHDLFLEAKKCEFNKEKVEYLGLVIEEGKVSTDPVKVKGFTDWPTPKSVNDVWSFPGFRNFY